MRVLLLFAITGCSYNPGSYSFPGKTFAGKRVQAGCVDLAVDRRADMHDQPVLEYQFGNRCDESVMIDLARVRAVGRTADGTELALAAYDPGGEIVPAKLGARLAGGEAIAYVSSDGRPIAQICVEVAAIANVTAEQWLCFAGTPGPIAAVSP